MKTALLIFWFIILAFQVGAKAPASKPVFSGTVNGHSIEIFIRYGTLDPKKRKVESREAKQGNGETYQQWMLQGKPVLGTNNSDPSIGSGEGKPFDTIDSITLLWDGKKREVPQELFDHIVLPHRSTSLKDGHAGIYFRIDPSGEAIIVDMGVGDGGGSSGISWLFTKDGTYKILHSGIFEGGG